MGAPMELKVADTWQALTVAGSTAAIRVSFAGELAAAVIRGGLNNPEVVTLLNESLPKALEDGATPAQKEGALLLVKALAEASSQQHALEAVLLGLLPQILSKIGDKAAPVKAAAEGAGQAIVAAICPHAVKLALPALFDGIQNRKSWKVQEGSTKLLGQLPRTGPRQLAVALHLVVPLLAELMLDGKDQVMKAAHQAMLECAATVGNRDIEGVVRQLVDAIVTPGCVPECINILSGITFVQPVLLPALAIMAPVFVRGMKERAMLVKRKTVVVIHNVLRLVEDPQQTAPFLPQLIPGVERVSLEVADPECRDMAGRVARTLAEMREEVERAEADGMGKRVSEAVLLEMLKGSITSGAREDAETSPLFKGALDYVVRMCAVLCENQCFEESEWVRCSAPYLDAFLSARGEDSEAVGKAFLKKVQESFRREEEEEEQDDEGEDLCNCEFSLGYGGKILLNSTRLQLKRGRRYGLCGHNGCGKSTLMRAIAAGKLDGFPPQDVLRTEYVEHDLDSSLVDMSPVEYLVNEELLKARGVDEAKATDALSTMGFSAAMRASPITKLSGGWKMKLALARAMLIGADILLLDEPTNHLDVVNIAWLEQYLTGPLCSKVSSLIVSHDSGFLDNVCTDIIHYEKRKLKHYRGNLSAFVKVKPEAKVYYDLQVAAFKFKLPVPGVLDGIKRKETPILKLSNVSFTYPGCDKPQLNDVNVQCSLGSRIAVVGVNGAGKSTLIKMMTGETRATAGTIWRHPNLGMAYVAQHAFHHVEQHMESSPNEYIRWRFARGEDREEMNKVHRKISKEEAKAMEEIIMHNGQRKQVEQLLARRKSKKSYEYEVKWVGLKPVFNSWLSRELLEDLGFEKLVHDIDAKEVARLGVYGRPLTIPGVQQHLDDFGLDAEFGTYGQIKNLSGGQKVKVVLAAAMWSNPHMIVLDEPTNFLDRDSLGALVGALHDFQGGVVVISHNEEFLAAVTNERWTVANGQVSAPGNPAYEKALKAGAKGKK